MERPSLVKVALMVMMTVALSGAVPTILAGEEDHAKAQVNTAVTVDQLNLRVWRELNEIGS